MILASEALGNLIAKPIESNCKKDLEQSDDDTNGY